MLVNTYLFQEGIGILIQMHIHQTAGLLQKEETKYSLKLYLGVTLVCTQRWVTVFLGNIALNPKTLSIHQVGLYVMPLLLLQDLLHRRLKLLSLLFFYPALLF